MVRKNVWLSFMYAPELTREKVDELRAGDIGCTVKLKDVKTGNTLNGKDCENRFNFIKYPNPKYTRAIKPVNEADTEKMMAVLNRMREEDPTWVVEQSKELRNRFWFMVRVNSTCVH